MLAMGNEFDKISEDPEFAELETDKPKVEAAGADTEVRDFFNSFFEKGPKEAVVHLALDPTPISTAEIMAATVPTGADGSDQTLEDILDKALYSMAGDMDARIFEMAKHAMASGIVRVFTQAGFVRMKRFDTVPTVQEHPTPAPQAPRQEPVPHAEQYPNSVNAEDLDRIVIHTTESGYDITMLTLYEGWIRLCVEHGDAVVPSADGMGKMLAAGINNNLRKTYAQQAQELQDEIAEINQRPLGADLDVTRPMIEITSIHEPGIAASRHPADNPHFTQIITSNTQPTGARIVNVGAPDDVEKP